MTLLARGTLDPGFSTAKKWYPGYFIICFALVFTCHGDMRDRRPIFCFCYLDKVLLAMKYGRYTLADVPIPFGDKRD